MCQLEACDAIIAQLMSAAGLLSSRQPLSQLSFDGICLMHIGLKCEGRLICLDLLISTGEEP